MDEDRFQMTVNCDCCGAYDWRTFYGSFWECLFCGVFRNGQSLSGGDPPYTKINTDWKLMRGDIEKFTGIMEDIESRVPKGSLYDVGCSYGYLVWLAYLRGWTRADGIDIDLGAVEAAKEMFGLEINHGQFEDTEYVAGPGFDCIVFHHGIEHLRSPMLAIERAISRLKPSGIIWMAHPVMPNREAAKKLISNGHQYEWTFEAFRNFISYYPQLSVVNSAEGEWTGDGVPSQYWVLRKVC